MFKGGEPGLKNEFNICTNMKSYMFKRKGSDKKIEKMNMKEYIYFMFKRTNRLYNICTCL